MTPSERDWIIELQQEIAKLRKENRELKDKIVILEEENYALVERIGMITESD